MPSKEAEAVASGDAGSPRIGNSGLAKSDFPLGNKKGLVIII